MCIQNLGGGVVSFFNIYSRTHMGFRKTKVLRIWRWRTCSDNDVSVLDLLYIVFIKKNAKNNQIFTIFGYAGQKNVVMRPQWPNLYLTIFAIQKYIYIFFQNVSFGVKLTPKWRHQHYFWLFSTFFTWNELQKPK